MSALSFTAGAFPNRNAISDTRWLPNALQVGWADTQLQTDMGVLVDKMLPQISLWTSTALRLAQAVPVYTHMEAEDYLIRGYAKCDTYNARVSSWYSSSEFVAKSQETEALR